MSKKILITGAGGFIGGFIVKEALDRGLETWAAVRASTNKQYISDNRVNIIELDFTDADSLRSALEKHVAENGKWDYIVHNLGATKCTNFSDFNTINYLYLKLLVDTLRQIDAVPESFLMMSSLSVMGNNDVAGFTPFTTSMIPMPNTRYGVSKLKGESYLQTLSDFPWVIFRATGVYGPRERDYFMMIKSIQKGWDFSVGFKPQMLTFIYVTDLARAVLDALEKGVKHKIYIIADEQPYTQAEFRKIVQELLGKRFVIPIRCPMAVVYAVSKVAEYIGKIRLKPSTLNSDKYNIMKQRNWCCDASDALKDFGWKARYSLRDGLRESIDWYKENKWI